MTAIWHRLTILLAENDENDLALIRRAFDRLRSLVRLIVVPDGELAIAYLQGEGKFANRDKCRFPTSPTRSMDARDIRAGRFVLVAG